MTKTTIVVIFIVAAVAATSASMIYFHLSSIDQCRSGSAANNPDACKDVVGRSKLFSAKK